MDTPLLNRNRNLSVSVSVSVRVRVTQNMAQKWHNRVFSPHRCAQFGSISAKIFPPAAVVGKIYFHFSSLHTQNTTQKRFHKPVPSAFLQRSLDKDQKKLHRWLTARDLLFQAGSKLDLDWVLLCAMVRVSVKWIVHIRKI